MKTSALPRSVRLDLLLSPALRTLCVAGLLSVVITGVARAQYCDELSICGPDYYDECKRSAPPSWCACEWDPASCISGGGGFSNSGGSGSSGNHRVCSLGDTVCGPGTAPIYTPATPIVP